MASLLNITWRKSPPLTVIMFTLIIVGLAAIILGDGASKAFANLGGSVIIRIMGSLLIIGAGLVIVGIGRNNAFIEVSGLLLALLGTSIYGCGAILGLHSQGLVSGLGYLGITAAMVHRVYIILSSDRRVSR
jgi:hypothetical protein